MGRVVRRRSFDFFFLSFRTKERWMKDEGGGKRMIHDYYGRSSASDHGSVLSLRPVNR